MIKRATKEEKKSINEVIETLPLLDSDGIRNIFVEDFLTNEFGEEIDGRYEVKKRGKKPDIYLNGRHLYGRRGKKIIAHEIGHHVFETRLTREQKRDWNNYSKNYDGVLVEGKLVYIIDPEERAKDHFCECYAHYFFDRAVLEKKEPDAFRYMEGIYENQRL